MEKKLEGYRRYTIPELKLEDEDLQMLMTMGIVIGSTYLDLLSLKNWLERQPQFRVIYRTISTTHLRVVKKEDYEKYLIWRRESDKKEVG